MLDPFTVGKFLFRSPAEFKEVSAKPDLLYVGLVTALCYYLLYCVFLLALFMLAQPHQTEPASTQQLDLVKAIWETVTEHLRLLFAQVVRILSLLLPFQLDLLKRVVLLDLLSLGL
jgi:hypothetical protein